MVAALAGLSPFGSALQSMVLRSWRARWDEFIGAFSTHGRWALVGVLSTEATSNAHAYILAVFYGAAAFAPIAAVALLFRPVGVVLLALTQFERPRMARHMKSHAPRKLAAAVHFFHATSLLLWAGNAVAVLLATFLSPSIVGSDYRPQELQIAAGLMLLITLCRSLRAAESATLQAAGHFRQLAIVTLVSAPLTVVGIAVSIMIVPTIATLTLVGVAVGEVVTVCLIRRSYNALGTPDTCQKAPAYT
jgi:O-antigen/teichoic acid export membrane protein